MHSFCFITAASGNQDKNVKQMPEFLIDSLNMIDLPTAWGNIQTWLLMETPGELC